jgi:hypothetical protein
MAAGPPARGFPPHRGYLERQVTVPAYAASARSLPGRSGSRSGLAGSDTPSSANGSGPVNPGRAPRSNAAGAVASPCALRPASLPPSALLNRGKSWRAYATPLPKPISGNAPPPSSNGQTASPPPKGPVPGCSGSASQAPSTPGCVVSSQRARRAHPLTRPRAQARFSPLSTPLPPRPKKRSSAWPAGTRVRSGPTAPVGAWPPCSPRVPVGRSSPERAGGDSGPAGEP